jgi:hypothetical protein
MTEQAFIRESQQVQWWLGELDRYDNVVKLFDGAHSEAAGAHRAYYLCQRLGLLKAGTKYAVVRCEVFEPVPKKTGVNEKVINDLNAAKRG